MALVLAMQEGRAFYVGDTKVNVAEARTSTHAVLEVEGPLLQRFPLGLNHATEILPGVRASLGLGSTPAMAKIVLEAPKSVRILRDSLYAQKPE